MSFITRRLSAVLVASSMLVSVAAGSAFAQSGQGTTAGPFAGTGNSGPAAAAPSNAAGVPAATTAAPSGDQSAARARPSRHRRHELRRHRHRSHHRAATSPAPESGSEIMNNNR